MRRSRSFERRGRGRCALADPRARLEEKINHLREDIDKVDEPQLKAMFETSAEVLEGLRTAFAHYENRGESAWR
ncbi:hypothetical protein EUU22_03275 [Ciceribacter ferrooxidans]|uniref:Uncharacterized protein n=1 Tax=Ciceribacter ferrooxidans TaxID=2509717 RepID=A0A4Q2TWV6_9HYPH|nr:hypothetical protein EUU22_03275 [Ciceribacter ferrooxidans]